MKKIGIYLVWIYSTLAFLFFGGMVSTIITQYPNWIHDMPESLKTTSAFYAAATPGTFFQLMSIIMLPIFIIMLISIWKLKKPRNLYLLHFLLFLVIGFGTASLIYPILGELLSKNISDDINKVNNLIKKFFLLDNIRSVVAILSCLLLILSLIAYHEKYFLKTE